MVNGKKSIYTEGIVFYEQPEGVISETISAIGGAAKEILNTPVALAVGTGVVLNGALDKMGQHSGNQFNGDVNADNSFNNSTLHQAGSASGTATMQPYTVTQPEPTIVHADVIEVGGE